MKKNKEQDTEKDSDGRSTSELTVIELLKMRHQKEKDEVEAIRVEAKKNNTFISD